MSRVTLPTGNAYVAGTTFSFDFPTANPLNSRDMAHPKRPEDSSASVDCHGSFSPSWRKEFSKSASSVGPPDSLVFSTLLLFGAACCNYPVI